MANLPQADVACSKGTHRPRLACVCMDAKCVLLVDLTTYQIEMTLDNSPFSPTGGNRTPTPWSALSLDPENENFVAVSSYDHHITVWNTAPSAPPAVMKILGGHDTCTCGLVFYPREKMLVTSSSGGDLLAYDLRRDQSNAILGTVVGQLIHAHGGQILTMDHLGYQIYTVGDVDGHVKLWDFRVFREVCSVKHGGRIYGVTVDEDHELVMSGAFTGSVACKLWDCRALDYIGDVGGLDSGEMVCYPKWWSGGNVFVLPTLAGKIRYVDPRMLSAPVCTFGDTLSFASCHKMYTVESHPTEPSRILSSFKNHVCEWDRFGEQIEDHILPHEVKLMHGFISPSSNVQ